MLHKFARLFGWKATLISLASAAILMATAGQAVNGAECVLNAGNSLGSPGDSLACGAGAQALGSWATAVGGYAGYQSTGNANTLVGKEAGYLINGDGNSAFGAGSNVVNPDNPAEWHLGAGAATNGNANSAFGVGTGIYVNGDGNAAYGAGAGKYVTGSNNTAIGSGAGSGTVANPLAVSNATSIGAGAQATRDNQVALGTTANTYTMAGITNGASTAAQVGPTYLTTTDVNGNLAATTFGTDALIAAVDDSTAINIAQDQGIADLDGRVSVLENGNAALSDQISETRTEARQGIAAAIAMANPAMPSAPGKTSWATNVGYFKGAVAFGGALTYRFDTPAPTALSLGYSYGGGDSHAARLGLQGEF